MKTVRPDNPAPIPTRDGRPQMGKIILRFAVLLAVAVGVLLLIWTARP
ncbi:hypothetical protein X566_12850 [Afipia sp. P52-10]|nr:hypothetical protein [Afipia sp. P52-10]ETR78447.1 hypothetical protein X566_12850 [Afipia sp. P52-10]